MSPHALSAIQGDHAEWLLLAMVISLSLNADIIVLIYTTRKEIKLDPLDRTEQKQDTFIISMVLLLLLIHMF